MSVSKEQLQELFTYDNGNLIWRVNRGNARIGDIAGETADEATGFRKVMIGNLSYRLHRLIWAYHNGWTTDNVKFIDDDRSNTRIENLRLVTKSEVLRDRSKFKGSSSKFKGVWYNPKRKKYIAQVKHAGKTVYVGAYDDELVAYEEWVKKAQELRKADGERKETDGEKIVNS